MSWEELAKYGADHRHFLQGLIGSLAGLTLSFIDAITPFLQFFLLLLTIIYSIWKFRVDYVKNEKRKKQ